MTDSVEDLKSENLIQEGSVIYACKNIPHFNIIEGKAYEIIKKGNSYTLIDEDGTRNIQLFMASWSLSLLEEERKKGIWTLSPTPVNDLSEQSSTRVNDTLLENSSTRANDPLLKNTLHGFGSLQTFKDEELESNKLSGFLALYPDINLTEGGLKSTLVYLMHHSHGDQYTRDLYKQYLNN